MISNKNNKDVSNLKNMFYTNIFCKYKNSSRDRIVFGKYNIL